MLVETVIESVEVGTTVTFAVAVLLLSSFDVAVIVTLPGRAGAVHVPVLGFIVPALADQAMLLVTPPVEVAVKRVVLLTVRVGPDGLIAFMTTVCGDTVRELSL